MNAGTVGKGAVGVPRQSVDQIVERGPLKIDSPRMAGFLNDLRKMGRHDDIGSFAWKCFFLLDQQWRVQQANLAQQQECGDVGLWQDPALHNAR